MLLDQLTFPGSTVPSCFMHDALTPEAAEIGAARDMDEFLGFARDRCPVSRRTTTAHIPADFLSRAPERNTRFKDQPVRSAAVGGTETRSLFEEDLDCDSDEVDFGPIRLKSLRSPVLSPEPVSSDESRSVLSLKHT